MKTKNAKECYELLKTGKYILIDVRTKQEHKDKKINFSQLNFPLNEINLWIKKLDKNKKYILYCRSGNRSCITGNILKKNNFYVINLEGGIISWIKEKFEII